LSGFGGKVEDIADKLYKDIGLVALPRLFLEFKEIVENESGHVCEDALLIT
jgi:hypothetical protein